MKEIIVELDIFSPRWGHTDVYEVKLTLESLTIIQGVKRTKCTWKENIDPEWSEE